MSASNPEKAVRALVPEPIVTPEGVAVRPLTLGTYALLERVASPILTGAAADVLGLLPSLYILCNDAATVCATLGRIEARAVAWADTLPPHAVGAIERAATEQVRRMLDVVAQEGDGKKKAGTDG